MAVPAGPHALAQTPLGNGIECCHTPVDLWVAALIENLFDNLLVQHFGQVLVDQRQALLFCLRGGSRHVCVGKWCGSGRSRRGI